MNLVPRKKVPWVSSHEIKVSIESDVPPPLHPAKVRFGGEVRFFKPVDAAKPPAIKTGPLQSTVSCRFLRNLIQEELSQILEAGHGYDYDYNEARCTRGLD
jgi:hypothetical protein